MRDREAEASGSDGRLRDAAQDRKARLEATLARQAKGDQEELRKQAEPVAQGLGQKTRAIFASWLARAPSPTPSEKREQARQYEKSLERQQREEERTARSRERRRQEELEYARAAAAHAPEPIRGPAMHDIFTPRQEAETTASASRGRTMARQVSNFDTSRSRYTVVSTHSTSGAGCLAHIVLLRRGRHKQSKTIVTTLLF